MKSIEPISQATYERVSLRDPDGQWELHNGQLREKPGMSVRHNEAMTTLFFMLANQLDPKAFPIRTNSARIRIDQQNFALPDILVASTRAEQPPLGLPERLEVYARPVPLVAEVWCQLAGDEYIDEKLIAYRARGDVEIWRIHPAEQTLTAWRRQDDGNYTETAYVQGVVEPATLPHVAIDLATLFT